jgi:hypothetical protein
MWDPTSVTFGVRHERIFGFLGRAGDILDAARRAQGGRVVPSKLFTTIEWPNPITARAVNKDRSLTVDFSVEGVVLTADLEKMQWSRQRAADLFLELTRIALPISRGEESVNRIGIVDNYVFDHVAPGALAVSSLTTLQNVGQPSDFTLRSAFRTNVEPPRAGVEDWRNTIIQVVTSKKTDESERLDCLRVSIDYQIYFVPERHYAPTLFQDHHERFRTDVEQLQRRHLSALASLTIPTLNA